MAEIQREILDKMKAWKENPRRKPLVLQGARQVGKSWALKKFGRECFEDMVYINFDTMPAVKEDFKRTKEPLKLIKSMELMTGKKIIPTSTLIVLDEIQECNEALNSLKYFCEDAPEYAVVCAGSLLGVALNRTGASFPVGKVDFMTLYPVSFAEYLRAADAQLYHSYQMIDEVMSVPEVLHQQLIDAYKLYLVLGGMPEAVSAYIDTRSWAEVKVVQDAILQSYSLDLPSTSATRISHVCFRFGAICRISWLVRTRSSVMLMFRKGLGRVSMREPSNGCAWQDWCIGFRR